MNKFLLIILTLIICLADSAYGQNYSVTETSFKNDSLTLFADIYTPIKADKKIGIALIQGSGNSDRTNRWSKTIAEILVENGYYVLLPDKRGCGKSEGSWQNASFLDLSTDAIESVHHLKNLKKLEVVGIMGLSQGGFIAPIAASKDSTIEFVIAIVGAAVTLEEQIIHEVTNTAEQEGLKPNEIKEVLDLHVLMKQYAFDRNWKPLEKRFAELDSSNWSNFARTFPNSPNIWVWDWIKLNIDFNPMEYWKQVNQPVFFAYGSKDEYDNVPVYESVYRLQKGFKSIGKENHVINIYETGHAMYEDDKAEIRKEFIVDLLNWLKKQ
jgi:uncharacterized protein